MQKKIIALAVAGLVSGAAFAQSNVTVYGMVDLGYVYSKSDYKKFQGVQSDDGTGGGPSRLGFRGEEGLGSGLKAFFKFEWQVAADEGGGPTGARYTYVGLGGSNWGDVTLGRDGTPSDYYLSRTGAWGMMNGFEPIRFYRQGTPLLHGDRWNNSVSYHSPNFSGLDFMGIYSFGEKVNGTKQAGGGYAGAANVNCGAGNICKGADTSDAAKIGIGVRYANGPLYLAAIYHFQANDDSAKLAAYPPNTPYAPDGDGAEAWAIGGTYDFKVVKLYANYFRALAHSSYGSSALTTATGPVAGNGGANLNQKTFWSLGLGVPVSTNGTVSLEYAQLKQHSRIDTLEGKSKGYGVGYNHKLSKRTALYTYLTQIKNDKEVVAGWSKTSLADEKQTNFGFGIVHLF
jgi:predicted porin